MALPPRTVTIASIDVLRFAADTDGAELRIDLRCGAGTYVRSLARDLGTRLGCGGYLAALRRTESGGLRVTDAITPERLEALAGEGRLADALLPVGDLLPLPRVSLEADGVRAFTHGSAVHMGAGSGDDGRRAVFGAGALLGVGVLRGGILQPDKVLPLEGES
jgi:tRNA pseudouridine55 synthase